VGEHDAQLLDDGFSVAGNQEAQIFAQRLEQQPLLDEMREPDQRQDQQRISDNSV